MIINYVEDNTLLYRGGTPFTYGTGTYFETTLTSIISLGYTRPPNKATIGIEKYKSKDLYGGLGFNVYGSNTDSLRIRTYKLKQDTFLYEKSVVADARIGISATIASIVHRTILDFFKSNRISSLVLDVTAGMYVPEQPSNKVYMDFFRSMTLELLDYYIQDYLDKSDI